MKTGRKIFLTKFSVGILIFLIFCMLAARNIYYTLLPQVEVSALSSGAMTYYLTNQASIDEENRTIAWETSKSEGDTVQEKTLSVSAYITVQTYTGGYDVQTVPLTVTSRTLSEDQSVYFYTASYEVIDGTYAEGTAVMAEMTWTSGRYNALVPLSAVKEDQNGTYLNVVRTERGLFSETNTVMQVRVEVEAQNGIFAAISGNCEPTDFIVVDTDKVIADGAQVRVVKG